MQFTVLISVYKKEEPVFFNKALDSIYCKQTVKPNEIILVQDGPLTPQLYSAISQWKHRLGDILHCIPLEKNMGLGDALNIGLKYCSNELVARMDTDDIAHPERFKKQLAVFHKKDVAVCGSWVTEFEKNETITLGTRKLPENHSDIVRYAKSRCPINHPAVMYSKSAVAKAGGYKELLFLEDYYLWARMLLSGAKFYNIQESLVHMRAGIAQLERRSGLDYAISELRLLKEFRKLSFLSDFECLKLLVSRVPSRLMPKALVRLIYRYLRTNY